MVSDAINQDLYLISMRRFKQIITESFSSQRNILIIFVILMIIPNLFLAYTEPYSATTIITSILLPAAFYTLWGIATKRVGVMILLAIPFMVLCAFQLVLIYLFGGSIIAVDMFTNLFTTNVSEAGELLGNIYPAVIGVCITYIPLIILGIYSLNIKSRLTKSVRLKSISWAAIMIVTGGISALYSNHCYPEFGIKYHVFPVNVCYNIKITFDRWETSNNFMKTSEGFAFGATKQVDTTQREVYIMVVGEASRALNWQLFGYNRPTTPRLCNTKGLVPFSDMLTQVNATHKTVPIILSPCSAENYDSIFMRKSIITLFKEAGFHTMFISNQVPNRSLIDYFSEEADHRIDISPRDGALYTESRYDGDMIDHIRQQLAESNENLFIVLHTYGSHFNFEKRYPREFARFTPDIASSVNVANRAAVVNAYDNSILYTDHVLSEIIGLLDSAQVRSALLYSADHGEDLMDDDRGRFLHASPTPTYYQLHVAAFAWFSDNYQSSYPQRYLAAELNHTRPSSTASLFHTIAQIANIESAYIDSTRSLVSDSYREYPRKYLNDHNKSVDFFNSGLKPQDFVMLDSMKIVFDHSRVHKIIY